MSSSSSSSVEERLENLRRQIRKLVDEASTASPSSYYPPHNTVEAAPSSSRQGGGDAEDSEEDQEELDSENKENPTRREDDDNDDDEDDDDEQEEERKRSLRIGMMLFGPEPTGSVDEALQRQLEKAEEELHDLVKCLKEEEELSKEQLDEDELERETQQLTVKLALLHEIQQIQAHLDKSDAMHVDFKSNSSNSSTSNMNRGETGDISGGNSNPNRTLAASSSSAFDGAVEACTLVVRAKQMLQQVQQKRRDEVEEKDSDKPYRSSGGGWEVIDGMLQALDSTVRRQSSDWQDAAARLWQVELVESSSGVDGSRISGQQRSLVVRSTPDMLRTCYNMYFVLEADWRLEDFVRDLFRDVWRNVVDATAAPTTAAAHDSFAFQTWTFHETPMPGRKGGRRLEWTVVVENDNINKDNDTDYQQQQQDRVMDQWKHRLESYSRLLQFCVDHVLVNDPRLVAQAVGPYLFGKPDARPENLNVHVLGLDSRRLGDDHGLLLEPLLDRMEETCLPPSFDSTTSGVPELLASGSSQLQSIVVPFVNALVEQGLIPSGDGYAKAKLLGLPDTLKQLYVDRCRIQVLDRARLQILNLDFHTTTIVESESFPPSMTGPMGQLEEALEVFRFPQCAVSITAFESMKLCRQTLQDATVVAQGLCKRLDSASLSSESRSTTLWLLSTLPGAMYRSARDVLDLFRNLIPARYGAEIAAVPRAAAIFHNDCAYMAYQCLTLGLEYKDLFPAVPPPPASDAGIAARGSEEEEKEAQQEASEACGLLRQTCTFVDMVPLFRNLAERALGSMLDNHARELVELVKPQIPLLGQALRSNEILQEWSDAESALRGALHHLRKLHQAWKPVLSQDILHGSMWYLSDVVLTLLLDQVGSARDMSTSATQFVSSLFASASQGVLALADNDVSASRALDRFQAYAKFMDMNLADIEVALSDGVFRSVTGTFVTSGRRAARRCIGAIVVCFCYSRFVVPLDVHQTRQARSLPASYRRRSTTLPGARSCCRCSYRPRKDARPPSGRGVCQPKGKAPIEAWRGLTRGSSIKQDLRERRRGVLDKETRTIYASVAFYLGIMQVYNVYDRRLCWDEPSIGASQGEAVVFFICRDLSRLVLRCPGRWRVVLLLVCVASFRNLRSLVVSSPH
jgi:hypothetical protein